MSVSDFHGKPNVPATVTDLDPDAVTEAIGRFGYDITAAARDLRVPSSDLRRLLWANPKLQDQAFEVVEARLDVAERNIAEALHSKDPRRRDAASYFTVRNTRSAKKRGWITSSTAGAEEGAALTETRTIQFTWAGYKPKTQTINRDGKDIEVPCYDDDRADGAIDGELSVPAAQLGHQDVEHQDVAPEPGKGQVPQRLPCRVARRAGSRGEAGAGARGLNLSERIGRDVCAVPTLPVWPGPYPPPPLVAHLYAPYAPSPRVAPARLRR